jgi:hypothetical protein
VRTPLRRIRHRGSTARLFRRDWAGRNLEMFDFFDNFRSDQLIPAGYNTIQFIRQWARASATAGEYTLFEALPPKQFELANRIVAEIEAREGQSVAAIPLPKIDEYIRIIARKLQELSLRDLHADGARGKILLDELRLLS